MLELSRLSALVKKHDKLLMGAAAGLLVAIWSLSFSYFTDAHHPIYASASSGPNLALGKHATQSSTYGMADAALAVDGNTNGDYNAGSVTHTSSKRNAWWEVDLGNSSPITSVVVWNRTDCCMDRLKDYWVFLSDTPFAPADTPDTLKTRLGTWSRFEPGSPSPSTIIDAGGAHGRYVRIQLADENFLSLAEVQVIGTTAASGLPLPAAN
jgi:hypothetical protein